MEEHNYSAYRFIFIELRARISDKMDHRKLSNTAKAKLTEFIPRHKELCISKLVANMPDEKTLLKMLDYIDNWKPPEQETAKQTCR